MAETKELSAYERLMNKRKEATIERDENGYNRLTKDYLRALCEQEEGLYAYPHLNSKLYLHYKG